MSEESKNQIVKQEEQKSQVASIFDATSEGLELFQKMCSGYAKINGTGVKFVADSLTKGRAMGVSDPFICMSMFWEMHDGKADLKTDALQKHLIDTGWILEPFEIIEDAVPLYYHYNMDELKLFIQGEGNAFYQKFVEAKGQKAWDSIAKLMKPQLFYKDSNPDLVAAGKECRTTAPYDYRTTLEATVLDSDGKKKKKRYSYLYSTACDKGLVHVKDKDGNPTKKIKSTWIDKSWMMYKRCASKLAGIVAPGAAYSAEGKFGYANPDVLDREHAEFVKRNGHAPTAKDVTQTVDAEIIED